MLSKELLSAFERTLRAGHYSLLLGAGVSIGSTNILGKQMQDAEAFRGALCKKYSLPPETTLNDAAEVLDSDPERKYLLIAPFTCASPPDRLSPLFNYCWRRIYSLNFDDVLERLHEVSLTGANKPKQRKLVPFHFNEPAVPERSDDELQLVHLHGTVRKPEMPIVLTLAQYAEITRGLNGWMVQLANFLCSSPFIVAGTRFSEPDIEHYLMSRKAPSARDTWGPSLWIEPNPTRLIKLRCARHGLTLVEATFAEFIKWLATEYSDVSAPWQRYLLDLQDVIGSDASADDVAAFSSNFRIVRSYRVGSRRKARATSKFFFGNEPTWEDIREDFDVPRNVTEELYSNVSDCHRQGGNEKFVHLLTGYAGSGRSTILKRLATRLAADQHLVLYMKPGKRIEVNSALSCLRGSSSTPILFVDSLFECAREVSDIIERYESALIVVGDERNYRSGGVRQIMRGWSFSEHLCTSLTSPEARTLVTAYKQRGILAPRDDERELVARIVYDGEPIAVSVCRLLNDYRPLDNIVDSLWNDSDEFSRQVYLCCALASHCVADGLRYEIADSIAAKMEVNLAKLAYGDVQPFRLHARYEDAVRDEFVRPFSKAIAERLIERRRILGDSDSLYDAFVQLSTAIAPYVTIESVRRRSPESRLAGRLFDVDHLLQDCLGNTVDRFFEEAKKHWEWNSQYWAQRALAKKKLDVRLAIQYARNAVRIEPDHPSPLNTLGSLLLELGRQTDWSTSDAERIFEEALTRQERAIRSAYRMNWNSEYPWVTLFSGAASYISSGQVLKGQVRERLENIITETKEKRWRFAPAVGNALGNLEGALSGSSKLA